MTDDQRFDPDRIKHMEMIPAVVARLAGNSFLVKGWAITLTGVLAGFGLDRDDWRLAAAAFVPILIFWALDAYYLRAERLFRELYNHVRKPDTTVEPFFLGATSKEFAEGAGDAAKWPVFRFAVLAVYLVLALATVAALIATCSN